jgi:plasmid maintenance system antidote protein VapI
MEWLKQIAPTIATALGGPLAGMAVSAISKAIGVDEKDVGNLIKDNKLTADQIAQVKLAEIELQKQANELGLNFEALAVDDRKSAREMQATTRSIVPPLLAAALTMMLGSLGTAWTGIIAYYFGSSAGSQAKTELLGGKK